MLKEIRCFEGFERLMNALHGRGAILITGVQKPNPMTIGWASLGVIWSKPVLSVLVRPSRHSFSLIESHDEFSVCVPPVEMNRQLAICGSRSGRDTDKFAECGFTVEAGVKIKVPHILECPLHFECKIVHKNNMDSSRLDSSINGAYYQGGDYHTVYFGEIVGAFLRQ